jgi:hypothetical protein
MPDHVIFQSWNNHPDFVVPEIGELTFTGFVNREKSWSRR